MLQEMVHSQDQQQLPIEEISSPLGAQLFEFCESELFPETLQNSEVASTSNNNCCYDVVDNSSSYQIDMNKYNNTSSDPPIAATPPATTDTSSTPSAVGARTATNFSIIFDDDPTDDQLENDISASIDFTPSPPFPAPHHQYNYNNNNINNNNNQEPVGAPFNISSTLHMMNGGGGGPLHQWAGPSPVVLGPPPPSYEDECMSSSYIRLRQSNPLMDPAMMPPFLPPPPGNMNAPFSADNPMFAGNGGLMLGGDLSHPDLDFQGDGAGLFLPDNLPRVFNCSTDLQTLSSESQHLVNGGTSTTPLASEISSLDDPTFKVGKLSVEERKRKIHRYMKKRNERNFSKKIKYACRKTLADSRPRVRGRFAKNDELGEIARTSHEDDNDDDVSLFSNSIPDHQRKVVVKEEEDLDSADIFAHISGVNSFKCNYPIQSWI